MDNFDHIRSIPTTVDDTTNFKRQATQTDEACQ